MPPVNNNPGTEMTGPPSGSFVTSAVLVPDGQGNRSQHTGRIGSGNVITGGNLIVNVVASDPYTGQTARLDNVTVEQSAGTLVNGIPPDGVFDLHVPSYEAFRRRDVSSMRATLRSTSGVVQNQSLPSQVRVRDTVDSFSNSPSPTCKQFNQNLQTAQRYLGLVHERDDLAILQGNRNGRSPGVAVNQSGGQISLFGIDGRQNMSMGPNTGIDVSASSFNTGSAMQENRTLQYGGMPQMNNPVNAVVPQGTILSPQPQTIPQIQKILNMVATVVDMIDLVKACRDAIDVIKNSRGQERENQLNDIRERAAGPGSFETAVYGDKKKAEEARIRAENLQTGYSTDTTTSPPTPSPTSTLRPRRPRRLR